MLQIISVLLLIISIFLLDKKLEKTLREEMTEVKQKK